MNTSESIDAHTMQVLLRVLHRCLKDGIVTRDARTLFHVLCLGVANAIKFVRHSREH